MARMAEPLKNSFGPDIPGRIAATIVTVFPEFDVDEFVAFCLDGFADLELTPRGQRIAAGLAAHLPANRERAIQILIDSLDNPPNNEDLGSMSGFFYMPHGYFVAANGLEHFDISMEALLVITKRFTSEFSIRPFLTDRRDETLARLHTWVDDPDEHVRRLVSEGTRPRLPWAARLPEFQTDPTPVIELLTKLKDDESEYVRRSVANNLNDIAKDHPELVVEIASRWWTDGDRNRRRLIRHGLRSLIKQGHVGALSVLGYGADSPAELASVSITPMETSIGERVIVEVMVANPTRHEIGVLVDLRVHFVKSNGSTSAKVFKGAELAITAGGVGRVSKSVSLRQHSTRTHYPGSHAVDVVINGTVHPAGSFVLR